MKASVLFFGATAAVTGTRRLEIEPSDGTSAREVLARLLRDNPGLGTHRLLFSINQQYASGDELICDGDELAVFTAVSGG